MKTDGDPERKVSGTQRGLRKCGCLTAADKLEGQAGPGGGMY